MRLRVEAQVPPSCPHSPAPLRLLSPFCPLCVLADPPTRKVGAQALTLTKAVGLSPLEEEIIGFFANMLPAWRREITHPTSSHNIALQCAMSMSTFQFVFGHQEDPSSFKEFKRAYLVSHPGSEWVSE